MPYKKPTQQRAIETEQRLLSALDQLLRIQSFEETSIEAIADQAGSTKSAFLQRFGSKDEALLVLFSIYADEASQTMADVLVRLDARIPLIITFEKISSEFDALLKKHFSANRAMNEYVKRRLESHDLTKKIFGECIEMMAAIQRVYFPGAYTLEGAKASAQLLVSLNFHYTMGAMPALPADPVHRHSFLAELLELAIKR